MIQSNLHDAASGTGSPAHFGIVVRSADPFVHTLDRVDPWGQHDDLYGERLGAVEGFEGHVRPQAGSDLRGCDGQSPKYALPLGLSPQPVGPCARSHAAEEAQRREDVGPMFGKPFHAPSWLAPVRLSNLGAA